MKTDNELIAEFMGWQQVGVARNPWLFGEREPYFKHPTIKGKWFRRVFQYDTSWDWLMPVVEKIESLGYTVEIANSDYQIRKTGDTEAFIFHYGPDRPKIKAVYEAVVEFIKWYYWVKLKGATDWTQMKSEDGLEKRIKRLETLAADNILAKPQEDTKSGLNKILYPTTPKEAKEAGYDAKYKIVDCNDVEMPLINDRLRTHDEAKELLERLNRNGEHRPYRMIRAWKTKLT